MYLFSKSKDGTVYVGCWGEGGGGGGGGGHEKINDQPLALL